MELLVQDLPPELVEILAGRKIHPDAHITPEMLRHLANYIDVGNPNGWMKGIVLESNEIVEPSLPDAFLQTRGKLNGVFETLNRYIEVMTELANTGNQLMPKDRKQYQESEMVVMGLAVESIKSKLEDPSTTRMVLALRGAKFFEKSLSSYASSTIEVEGKRIRLEEQVEGEGTPFIMGLGNVEPISAEQAEGVKTLLMPDDCLSTGMTQLALLESLFQAGYKPENVVMVFTVGTTAGIDYVHSKFDELIAKYGLKSKLTLQCGGICHRVNGEMYLMTKEGLYMVGDMGGWNEAVDEEIPAWGDLVGPVVSNIDPGSGEFPSEVNPRDADLIEG